MREIKFRAWEKELKEMITVSTIDFIKGMINTDSTWRYFHEVELMQYTGLKDKNGVEIYEGDILKCFNGSQDKVGTVVHVCYDDTYTGYYPFNRDEVGFNTNSNSIEVIGNIYEHKHLLEEYKNENK